MPDPSPTTLSWSITLESDNSTGNSSAFQIPGGTGFSDEELIPLWVPYVILTVFLLALVVLSFVRFHWKRISQNRERLEAIADKLEKEQATAALLATQRNGETRAESDVSGIHPAASDVSYPMSGMTSPSSTYVPTYLDVFLSFSETCLLYTSPSPRD